jgi:hypothetical protein
VFWRKSKAPILAVVSGPTLLEQFHQDCLQVAKCCSTSVLATPFRSTFRILTWAFMALWCPFAGSLLLVVILLLCSMIRFDCS